MEITASSVARKHFTKKQRGYDPKEVATYLDSVGSVMATYERDLNQLAAKIERLQEQLAGARQAEEAVKLTIIAASRAKEEMLGKAQIEADRMVTAAVADAAAVRADAELIESRTKEMISHAQLAADEIILGADQKVETRLAEADQIINGADQKVEARLAEADADAKQRVAIARREALALLEDTRVDAEQLITVAIEEESHLQERVEQLRAAMDLVEKPLRMLASGALEDIQAMRDSLPTPALSAVTPPAAAQTPADPFAAAVEQQAEQLIRRDFDIVGGREPVAVAAATPSKSDAAELMDLAYAPGSELTA